MKINNKAILEFLGFLTVAASLMFVGMQLLLDRKIAVADQYYNRAETVKQDKRTLMVTPTYYQAKEEEWANGERPSYWNENWKVAKQLQDGTLSVSSLVLESLMIQVSIIGYDNVYFQYKQGLIDESVWKPLGETLKMHLRSNPEFYRAVVLRHVRPTLRPLVQQWVDEMENLK